MHAVPMNKKSGSLLHSICHSLLDNSRGLRNLAAVALSIEMEPDVLQRCCAGREDLPWETLERLARKRDTTGEVLQRVLHRAYMLGEEEKREKERQEQIDNAPEEERSRLRDAERRRKFDETKRLEALRKVILQELRDYGIHDNYLENEGEYALDAYSPVKFILHYCNDREYLPKLEALLQTCSDEDLADANGNALMWAGNELAYEKYKLLENRKDFIARYINSKDVLGWTPLHYAAQGPDDDPRALRLLLAWGAEVNARTDTLLTALHIVAERNQDNRGSRAVLHEHGAVSTKDLYGQTPDSIQDRLDALDAW